MVLSNLTFKSSRLIPRGYTSYDIANNDYVATSLNYQLPVWYPDGGIRGVIYFKRLRVNVGADYASFQQRYVDKTDGSLMHYRKHLGSFGLDLGVDFNPFVMPDAATISVTFSLYRKMELVPFKDGKFYFGFSMGLPF